MWLHKGLISELFVMSASVLRPTRKSHTAKEAHLNSSLAHPTIYTLQQPHVEAPLRAHGPCEEGQRYQPRRAPNTPLCRPLGHGQPGLETHLESCLAHRCFHILQQMDSDSRLKTSGPRRCGVTVSAPRCSQHAAGPSTGK